MKTINRQKKGRNLSSSPWFDLSAELQKHAWFSNITAEGAEELLTGKPMYTYLIRPDEEGTGFCVTFVSPSGKVKHDHFTLIDPVYGVFRNYEPCHVGSLKKVLRDLMHCSLDEGAPLV